MCNWNIGTVPKICFFSRWYLWQLSKSGKRDKRNYNYFFSTDISDIKVKANIQLSGWVSKYSNIIRVRRINISWSILPIPFLYKKIYDKNFVWIHTLVFFFINSLWYKWWPVHLHPVFRLSTIISRKRINRAFANTIRSLSAQYR